MAALLAVPGLPAPAGAGARQIASGTAILPPNLYTWSATIARTKGACSPEMLMRALPISQSRAAWLIDRLVANSVIGPVDALGFGKLVEPVSPTVPNQPALEPLDAPPAPEAAMPEADEGAAVEAATTPEPSAPRPNASD